MVVGRRMRNEQPEAVARVRVGHETSSIETIRQGFVRPPCTGCEHRALDGFPNLTFGYTSRAVGSFHFSPRPSLGPLNLYAAP